MKQNFLLVPGTLLGIHGFLISQSGWTATTTNSPGQRAMHSMAHDSIRGRTVLFGGENNAAPLYGDTWEWNGSNWTAIFAMGPAARYAHALAFDSQLGQTLLFGGSGAIGYLGDTWTWNGSTWIPHILAPSPSARMGHAMTFDASRGKVLLFGGINSGAPMGDTWEWNGSAWSQLSATGPQPRIFHAMACDGHHTLMFGGYVDVNTFLGDTWEWAGTSWSQVATGGPTARRGHVLAFDGSRIILFGGQQADNTYLNDTWEWNYGAWTPVAGSSPAWRRFGAASFDGNNVLLFGGDGVTSRLGDTWQWVGRRASATPFGQGCGTPPLMLSPNSGAPPAINSTSQVMVTDMPGGLAFVALGWSRTHFGSYSLPVTLAGFGMPGCNMLQSSDVPAQPITIDGLGIGHYSLAVPNWSGIIGVSLSLQAWAPAPSANQAGVIVSNGVDWVIGY